MGSKVLLLLFVILVLVSKSHCWQHASEADFIQAIKECTKPLLVTYVFFTSPAFDQGGPTLTPRLTDSTHKSQPSKAPVFQNSFGQMQELTLYRGSSQDLEPHWTRVEVAVQGQQLDIHVMSIDCSTSLTTCLDLDVKAYPAIRLYLTDGRNIRYRGPRKSTSILSFLHRALRPIITDLTTPEEHTSFITSDDIVFLANFTPSEGSLYEEHFRHLARRYHDRYTFGIINQRTHPNEFQESKSTIRCYNNPNSETFTLTSRNLPLPNSLTELLSQCTAPLIYEPVGRRELAELASISSQNAKSGLIVHFFTKSTSPPSSSTSALETDQIKDDYKKEILPLAKKYASEILFTVIDGDEHPGMGPTVGGLPSDVTSGVSIVRTGELFPFLSRGISADELEEFLGDVLRGEVKPWDGHTVTVMHAEGGDGENAAGAGHDEL